MHRIDHVTAVGAPPATDPAGTPGYFTNGDPGGGVPATVVTADWVNDIQESLIELLTRAGVTAVKGNKDNVADAIQRLLTALPVGGLTGLKLTWTDADTMSVAAGKARDQADGRNLVLASAMSKEVANDSAWTAGAAGNAMPSAAQGLGRAASTWYAVFLIGGDGVATDWGLDTNTSAVNLLAAAQAVNAAYTRYRRIGWVRTDGSENLIEWIHAGDDFLWATPQDGHTDGSDQDYVTASVLRALAGAPPEVEAQLALSWTSVSGAGELVVGHPSQTLATPSQTAAPGAMLATLGGTVSRQVFVRTDSSRQIRVRSSFDVLARISAIVYGWRDTRGRDL